MRFRYRTRSSGFSFGGWILFTIFWCAITGVFVGFALHSIIRQLDAQRRFAETTGVVISSAIKTNSGDSDSSPTYKPLIHYRYTVNGKEYESDRMSFGEVSSSNHRAAQETVARFSPGLTIPVYYNPSQPDEAILQLAISSDLYFLVFFLQPFILVALGLIVATVTFPLKKRNLRAFLTEAGPNSGPPWAIPTWGVLAPDYNGVFTIRSGRTSFTLLALGFAGGYGITCFFNIFIVGIFFREQHPRAIGLAFLVAVMMGVGVAMKMALFPTSRALISVDTRLEQVRVDRKQETQQIHFKDIEAWKLQDISNPRRVKTEGESPLTPLLYIQTRAGTEIPVHVFKADNEALDIARKTGQLFASITGAPFQDNKPEERSFSMLKPSDWKAAFQMAREAARESQQYRDLV